jgi:hypothetical protein
MERSKCFVQKIGTIAKGSSLPSIFAAATWPWRSATTRCSARRLPPVIRIGPAGNVACGKNLGVAGLQTGIDKHAAETDVFRAEGANHTSEFSNALGKKMNGKDLTCKTVGTPIKGQIASSFPGASGTAASLGA